MSETTYVGNAPARLLESLEDLRGIGPSLASQLTDAGIDSPARLIGMSVEELQELPGIGETKAATIHKQVIGHDLERGRQRDQRRARAKFDPYGNDGEIGEHIDVGVITSQKWNKGRECRNLKGRVRDALSDVTEHFDARIHSVSFFSGSPNAPSNAPHKVINWAVEDLNDVLPERARIGIRRIGIPWNDLPEAPMYTDCMEDHPEVRRGSTGKLYWVKAPQEGTKSLLRAVDVVIFMDDHDFLKRDIAEAARQRTKVFLASEIPEAELDLEDESMKMQKRREYPTWDENDPVFDPSPMDTDEGRENPWSETQSTLEEEQKHATWTKWDRQRRNR